MKYFELAMHNFNAGKHVERHFIHDAMTSLLEIKNVQQMQLQMGMLLYGLSILKPSVNEILGLVDFVKDVDPGFVVKKIDPNMDKSVIGVSGSGKKGIKTINISTASALTATVAGVAIVKPISKSTSSLTGSTDILESFGAQINISHVDMMNVMKGVGFGAFSIERSIPIFDGLYGGNFLVPHALSYVLAALVNPVNCTGYIHGYAGMAVDTAAAVLSEVGLQKGAVISSTEDSVLFMDELSPLASNNIAYFKDGDTEARFDINIADMFSCPKCTVNELKPGYSKEEQINIFGNILRGNSHEAYINAISLNAAFILMESEIEREPRKAFRLSCDIIRSGVLEKKLSEFCNETRKYNPTLVASGQSTRFWQ